MSAFLGVPGSFYEVHGGSTLRTTDMKSQAILTLLGGRRIAQQGAESRRTWDVAVENADAATLSRLAVLRATVPMPWAFYSAWALVTNVMTPDQSLWRGPLSFTGASLGELVDLADGGFARSLNDTPAARTFTVQYPVTPGVPVTAGVYARQAGAAAVTLRLTWVNAAGAVATSTTVTRSLATSGPLQRITVTAAPPIEAVSCYLVVTNHSVIAAPSLTFTSSPMPWSIGAGCLTAVIDGIASDALAAWAETGGQRTGYSFSVTEVG